MTPHRTRNILICSGKGGVGKTTLTANLGIALARQGVRTAVLDAVSGNFVVSVNNASKAKVKGIELGADLALGAGLSTGFSAAYIESELLNYVSPSTRKNLSGLPLPLTPSGPTPGVRLVWQL